MGGGRGAVVAMSQVASSLFRPGLLRACGLSSVLLWVPSSGSVPCSVPVLLPPLHHPPPPFPTHACCPFWDRGRNSQKKTRKPQQSPRPGNRAVRGPDACAMGGKPREGRALAPLPGLLVPNPIVTPKYSHLRFVTLINSSLVTGRLSFAFTAEWRWASVSPSRLIRQTLVTLN